MRFKMFFVIFTAFCFFISYAVAGIAQEKYTEADAKTLKGNDPDAVSEVLFKLVDLYETKGRDALKSAVPDLLECLKNEMRLPEDERWNVHDIVKVLSLTGDERIKPALLNIMSVLWGGGNPYTAQGFLAIGASAIVSVADSLKSSSPDTKGRAALTLYNMHKYDESGKFFSEKDRKIVREGLVANLTDENVNIRIFSVMALKSFGDESVIPQLEHIEKHDAHKDSGGTYEVRIEATETLKALRGEI